MEMRKFIIELHPDGKMTWCEYEDSRDSEISAYNAALRDVINRLTVEHCNYLSMANFADNDEVRYIYLKLAATCKRMSNIVENMAK
jgi:hypothetical protein